ncbi:MAG: MBL fold metallo-hydrolase [Pirellulaceae bacterium]|jgi:metallo-beta-lactamase family protein
MEITHHGGRSGVTGSCHQLRLTGDRSVLIDCGSFQGRDAIGHEDPRIDFPLKGIEALLVTHVHIDHIGRIPYLLAAGFDRPIYCSQPTARLLPVMLEDSIRLGITRNRAVIRDVLGDIKKLLKPLPYGTWEKIGNDLTVRYQPAGHVLGSSYVEIEHDSQRVVFSGDLGSRMTPILDDPKSPERADTLVLESTYGNRNHEGREVRLQALEKILCHTMRNKGVTIIPAFSLGRTQELLYEMNRILENIGYKNQCSMLGQIPILVDSPLARRLTEIYTDMTEFWDAEAKEVLSIDDQPLVFQNLIELDGHREHQKMIQRLQSRNQPAIVIAGSGMCVGGRVVNYLKQFLGRESTDVVFIGYQAEGTPGRVIQSGRSTVRLDGRYYPIRAKVHTLTGYSAHADQSDLLKFVQGIPEKPKEIRLVHGEALAQAGLREKLEGLSYRVT